MNHRISRLAFLKKLWIGLSGAILASCKRVIAPAPTDTPSPTREPSPTKENTPTATSTPQLPNYCVGMDDAEAYLFGVGATRVKELEPGVYQIVIDKNINLNAFSAEFTYILLAEIDPVFTYQVLLLGQDENLIDIFDADFNPADGQLSAFITGLREGDTGILISAMLLSGEQTESCMARPDFAGKILRVDGQQYRLLGGDIRFEPILVKSRTGGGSSSSTGSSAGGTSGGTTTSGGPSVSGVSGTGGDG